MIGTSQPDGKHWRQEMQKLLLRPKEVGEALGVSRSTVYELIASGQLPGVVRVGKSVRVSCEVLEQWVRDQAIRE